MPWLAKSTIYFTAGVNMFELYKTAIQNTKSIIVIYSENFKDDFFLYEILLCDYICRRSRESTIHDKRVFIIKRDDCMFPHVCETKYALIDTTQEYATESDTTKKVCEWAETIFPWCFRLVKCFMFYYHKSKCLYIYACVVGVLQILSTFLKMLIEETVFETPNLTLICILLLISAQCIFGYIVFVQCVYLLIQLDRNENKKWNYYIEKHISAQKIDKMSLFYFSRFLFLNTDPK